VSIHTLVAVGYVQEEVLFMMFLVERSHGRAGWWNNIVDKEEECILWPQMDSLSD